MDKRCNRCVGSGEILGGGMMHIDCVACNGTGRINEPETIEPVKVVLDKRSGSYRDAVTKIMALNPGISRKEAGDMFDREFEKLEA